MQTKLGEDLTKRSERRDNTYYRELSSSHRETVNTEVKQFLSKNKYQTSQRIVAERDKGNIENSRILFRETIWQSVKNGEMDFYLEYIIYNSVITYGAKSFFDQLYNKVVL